jgi:hypothetical protein
MRDRSVNPSGRGRWNGGGSRATVAVMGRSVVLMLALLALVAALAAPARPASAGVPVGTFAGCPRDVRPLSSPLASYEPAVKRAVLAFVQTGFLKYAKSPPSELVGARAVKVLLVRHWLPSGWIKQECGLLVWQRSVAVDVYFPRLDKPHNPVGHCNACASLVFITARTPTGWTVWARY